MLNIAIIYPELLNYYGDHGNIIVLQERLSKRNLSFTINTYRLEDEIDFKNNHIYIVPAGAYKETLKALDYLKGMKTELKQAIDQKKVFFLSGYSSILMGSKISDGQKNIDGLNILSYKTKIKEQFYTNDIVVESNINNKKTYLVGFENHNYKLLDVKYPFGKVIKGCGNAGKGYEGILYGNLIMLNMVGPVCAKNPSFADYLIKLGYEAMGREQPLEPIDDTLEDQARAQFLEALSVT